MDLDIQGEYYMDNSVVTKLNDMIQESQQNEGYIPTKLEFKDVSVNDKGIYNTELEHRDRYPEEDTAIGCFKLLTDSIEDMEQIVKQTFNLSEDKKQRFSAQNTVSMTLRQELEMVHLEKKELQEKIERLNKEIVKSTEDTPQTDYHKTIKDLKYKLERKEKEVKEQEEIISNIKQSHSATQNRLNIKTDELQRLENKIFPKIKETKEYHKSLAKEIKKIKEDGELLPSMFRAEAQFRNQCKQEKDEAFEAMEKALKSYEKLKAEKRDLKHELERKERLALQAIAARQSMKDSLSEATGQLKDVEKERDTIREEMEFAKSETDHFQEQYEKMFNSVSSLNKRIEELEDHKKNLLDKLKRDGNTTDLDYLGSSHVDDD